jgi:PAS domain S-box-containing protein
MSSADQTAHDITDRRRTEPALQDTKGFSENLIQTANVIILGLDTDGNVNLLNNAGEEITGYTFAELKGKNWSILVPRDRFPHVWAEFDRLVGETAGKTFENPIVTKSGEERLISWRNSVVKDNGKVVATISFGNDITDRKMAEEALRRREEDYHRFVAQSSEGIFREDMDAPLSIDLPEDELVRHIIHDSYLAECNDALARMYGSASGQEMLGKRLSQMLVADDPRNIELIREFIRSGFKMEERESHEVDIHGAPKVFLNSIIGIVENGKLVCSWGIQRDVTEQVKAEEGRKRAEQLLVESEERFRVALKDSPITVFNQDRELRYTWIYNPQNWQQEAIGKTDAEIIGPRKAASLEELKRRVLKTGMALRQEVMIPNGATSHAFDVTIEPLLDTGGNVIGITGSSMDIAQLREMTDRLQDARDKLAQEKLYLEGEIQAELGFEEIIGQSPALLEVLKNVRVVAPTESSVLLLGETGTGKELVARSVHSLSSRLNNTFIKLNCAAVPAGLLESELFGHEKGAFTGAVSQKIGRIELADKGTLLLDEIGELPLELQPKLLRVLQDREFERLGGVRTLHVDVRIISATNRDLHQDVADKKFREDLFYRLNVFPIELPALRQRRTDIPILVHHFVRKHSARMRKHIDIVPAETMRVLQNWNWPGNIRELENLIERMVILSKGRVLAAPPVELDAPPEVGEDNLTEMEREHIVRVLQETNGVLSGAEGAATRLGMKRTTLQSMLKRLGIELDDYRRGNEAYGPS